MKPFLFLQEQDDGSYRVAAECDDSQATARKVARDLEPGEYLFVRVQRPVSVAEPERVVRPQVEWGESTIQRRPKAKTQTSAPASGGGPTGGPA